MKSFRNQSPPGSSPIKYYKHFSSTYQVESASSSNPTIWRLSLKTGEFVRDTISLVELEGPAGTSYTTRLSEDRFIQKTEQLREYYLRGSAGPIFELYDSVNAILTKRHAENRGLTPDEIEVIASIRRRTFAMWEDELRRRAIATPMTEPTEYYKHRSWTYRVEAPSSRSPTVWRLNLKTGEFVLDDTSVLELDGPAGTSYSTCLSEAEFISRTEALRARHLRGTGPIFTLYESIRPIVEADRRLSEEEVELVRSTRQRTFAMWEDELRRRAAGEPPSFTVESDMLG
ncbi:MAG TPA: hypothetical protein VM677_03380 [Actinokineospora sp.]|jgi:hypothetical protein|nr:hypothetical protein [Actinokineospora sp.]